MKESVPPPEGIVPPLFAVAGVRSMELDDPLLELRHAAIAASGRRRT
jgi:hypothetical protein